MLSLRILSSLENLKVDDLMTPVLNPLCRVIYVYIYWKHLTKLWLAKPGNLSSKATTVSTSLNFKWTLWVYPNSHNRRTQDHTGKIHQFCRYHDYCICREDGRHLKKQVNDIVQSFLKCWVISFSNFFL